MKLSALAKDQQGIVSNVSGDPSFKKRIEEMGFVQGQKINVVKFAPLQDPIEYHLMGYNISLRKSEADLIEIVTTDFSVNPLMKGGVATHPYQGKPSNQKSKEIHVALVGNPNAGKTTLFNYASGAKEHVGNYSGVTVDSKTATLKKFGYTFYITDLPGTYSLSANSPEEVYARQHLLESNPDVVLNITDATNLERNLYLTTQLMDMGLKIVMALNMIDELKASGSKLDHVELSKRVNFPIIPTASSKGEGIDALFQQIITSYEENKIDVPSINYNTVIEQGISAVQKRIGENNVSINGYKHLSSRFTALKLIEKDAEFSKHAASHFGENVLKGIEDEVDILEKQFNNNSASVVTEVRYGVIHDLLDGLLKVSIKKAASSKDKIDDILTHRIWGFPVFLGFMWLMFQATFELGQYPMDWIEIGMGMLGDFIGGAMSDGPLKGLLVDGVIGGVGGVIVFLPNILILFLFISLMEDTGYMARAVFIMDKLMHRIGLHGKSFIPLVMGFGCNVPAIMATRTLGNKNDRLLTMLINPFMSCSARLPVYILVIGAFFPNNPGTMLFAMYFIGVALAILLAILFKKLLFNTTYTPFVMELPPFRLPTLKTSLIHMWNKGSQYLKKMGGVILVASIIIWALGYYPREAVYSQDYDIQISQVEDVEKIELLEFEKEGERFEQSYIGRLGQFIEPVIQPLGFDWKMGVSLVTGFAAKEIVVSTMGVLYQADPSADETSATLMHKLRDHRLTRGPRKGEIAYTPLVAFSFMLFVLIYFPCVSTIAAINSESGSKKWAIFAMVYPTVLAWILSFAVFQIGSLWMT